MNRFALALALFGLLAPAAGCKKETSAAGGEVGVDIDVEAARQAAEQRSPDDISMPWLEGSTLNKPQAMKRFGRFIRNSLWDRLAKVSRLAVEQGDLELLAMGYFHLAYLEGRKLHPESSEEDKRRVLEMVKTAVDLGYRNPHEIANAPPLRPLHDLEAFEKLILELEQEFNEKLRTKAKELIDEQIAHSQEADGIESWSPELRTLGGEDFWRQGPMLVVASRIHHAGFNKLHPRLRELHADFGDRLAFGVVFYQLDPENESRVQQTEEYVAELGVEFPVAVVGRDTYKGLLDTLGSRHEILNALRERENDPFNPFQPLGIFITPERKPLYLSRGVIADWELRYITETFLEATGDGAGGEEVDTGEESPSEGNASDTSAGESAEEPPGADASGETSSSEGTPREEASTEESPAEETSGHDSPPEESSEEETSTEESPAEETSGHDSPPEESSEEEASTEESPAEETSGHDSPPEESSAEDRAGEGS